MNNASERTLKIGDEVPDFKAQTTIGPLEFYKWIDKSWCILFSHPLDFTPVCTTELGYAAKIKKEFIKRNVKLIALSVNDLESHHQWIKEINQTQHTTVDFPIIADPTKEIAALYGMIHPKSSDTATVRNVFIIDPAKKLRLLMIYPASTGRNFTEILRVIDSLQLTDNYKVATPVNWQKGEECIILPSITDPNELKIRFPKGYRELTPYLKITPSPE